MMDKKEKENKLMEKALKLFTEKGVNNTSIQDIADEAGVGKGTFYLYFKDKYDIRDKVIASCSNKLFSDALDAMKTKNVNKKNAVQMVRTAILQIEKDKGIEVSDKQILGIVAKEVKTRKDAIAEYEQANREDLIEKANEEIKALEEYLPKQLTDEELVAEVKKVIEKLNATSMKDMGPVMKEAKATIGAQADGKRINEVVKSLLA